CRGLAGVNGVRLHVGLLGCGRSTSQDHIGRLFRNHHDWCIGVATDNSRHDGCIDDTKILNPVNAQLVVHDGHSVPTHPRCSYRMVMCLRELPYMSISCLGSIVLRSWIEFPTPKLVECWLMMQFPRDAQSRQLSHPVTLGGQVVMSDPRLNQRI